jgi:hypothetical protein
MAGLGHGGMADMILAPGQVHSHLGGLPEVKTQGFHHGFEDTRLQAPATTPYSRPFSRKCMKKWHK